VEQDIPLSETIASPEPTLLRSRRLLVACAAILAVAAIGSTFAAVHYRRQVDRLRGLVTATASSGPSSSPDQAQGPGSPATVTVAPESPPPLSVHNYDMTVGGQPPTTVYLTTASTEGGGSSLGQLLITALVRGAQPGATYRLGGGDCDTNSSVVWAQGVADATGTAFLTGQAWTLPKADQYSLALDASPSPASPPRGGGIEGEFVLGQASRYNGEPCS
jgi:hypothetical protein